ELVDIDVTVHNYGGADADSTVVSFSDNGLGAVFQADTLFLAAGAETSLVGYWIASGPPADHLLGVRVFTSGGGFEESLENNLVTTSVSVGGIVGVSVVEKTVSRAPSILTADAGRPNPFRTATTIPFSLPSASRVVIDVYDVRGRLVASVLDGFRDAGHHEAIWSGTSTTGRPVPAGIYFYRLTAGGKARTGKMVLLR
ncbi:MAG: T9SS type A sorting domain-containing protein, partial [Planctomycetota bacterium]